LALRSSAHASLAVVGHSVSRVDCLAKVAVIGPVRSRQRFVVFANLNDRVTGTICGPPLPD
jgi:hypothetical protein